MSESETPRPRWREVRLELQPEEPPKPRDVTPPPADEQSEPVPSAAEAAEVTKPAEPIAFDAADISAETDESGPPALPPLDPDAPEFHTAGRVDLPKNLLDTAAAYREHVIAVNRPVEGGTIWHMPVVRILLYFILMAILSSVVFNAVFDRAPRYFLTHPNRELLLAVFAEAVAAFAALVIMMRANEHRPLQEAGVQFRGIVMETTGGAMIGIAVISVAIGVMALTHFYHVIGKNPYFHPVLPLVVCLLIAVAEEIMFRGYVFRVLENRYGSFIALIVSSLFFGLIHLFNESYASIPLEYKIIGPIFIGFEAGILLAAAYMTTRRLWLPIGIHWAWNYFEGSVYGGSVSGEDLGGSLIRARFNGPFLLTGGSFGPEASIFCLIFAVLAGLLLLRVAVRAGQWRSAGLTPAP